jgi:signal recognition particle subunit SRP54
VKGSGRSDKDLAQLIVMFGGMRVKMQKLTEQMGGAAAEVGLTPQLSEVGAVQLLNVQLLNPADP